MLKNNLKNFYCFKLIMDLFTFLNKFQLTNDNIYFDKTSQASTGLIFQRKKIQKY